ncbi:MAG: hypothetical protein K9N51_12610 [Candidatus Pacebacteria bacterium]|nr:hypothetical protein [Candidatus Paceibacterota bacterium]
MPASTAGSKCAIFRQVCELTPPHLVPKLARKHGIKSCASSIEGESGKSFSLAHVIPLRVLLPKTGRPESGNRAIFAEMVEAASLDLAVGQSAVPMLE